MKTNRTVEYRARELWPKVRRPRGADGGEDGPIALLRAVLAVLLRHKLKLVIWVVGCIAVAAAYARATPPIYAATAMILLEPRRSLAGPARDLTGASSFDLHRADSEIQVIRSERLLSQVFNGLGLVNHAELGPRPPGLVRTLLNKVRGDVTAALLTAEDAWRTAFANFKDRLSVRRVGQSYVVEVSYTSSDSALVARAANAAASAYLLQSLAFKAETARNGVEFVQGRVDALSAQVQAAAAAVRAGAIPDGPTPDADARIIGAALPPMGPSAPRPTLIVAFGAAIGVASALFAAALASVLDRRIRTPGRLTGDIGLACLAVIPEPDHSDGPASRRMVRRLFSGSPAARLAYHAAMRDLLTSIKLAGAAVGGKRRIVVALVSWEAAESARTLAMGLGRLIQEMGKAAVVIDADVHGARELPDNDRLGDSLSGLLASGGPIDQMVLMNLDGVAYLPASAPSPGMNRALDFCDPRMALVLDQVRSKGDVILSLPPLSVSADAKALALLADAVVLVTIAGSTTVDGAKEAMQALDGVGANVIGAVISRGRACAA